MSSPGMITVVCSINVDLLAQVRNAPLPGETLHGDLAEGAQPGTPRQVFSDSESMTGTAST